MRILTEVLDAWIKHEVVHIFEYVGQEQQQFTTDNCDGADDAILRLLDFYGRPCGIFGYNFKDQFFALDLALDVTVYKKELARQVFLEFGITPLPLITTCTLDSGIVRNMSRGSSLIDRNNQRLGCLVTPRNERWSDVLDSRLMCYQPNEALNETH